MELILGFHRARPSKGIAVIALEQFPAGNEFDLAGNTNVPTHRRMAAEGLDNRKLKELALANWAHAGANRMVKVRPVPEHSSALNNDLQVPPGHGVPQWIAKVGSTGSVVALITGYLEGAFAARPDAH